LGCYQFRIDFQSKNAPLPPVKPKKHAPVFEANLCKKKPFPQAIAGRAHKRRSRTKELTKRRGVFPYG
jgi:hypothetical protein